MFIVGYQGAINLATRENLGTNALYKNDGKGGFEKQLDLGPISSDTTFSRGAAWGDYDGTYYLPLATCHLLLAFCYFLLTI